MYVASDKADTGSAVARIAGGNSISFMYRGWVCFVLMELATSTLLTSNVVGIPFRPNTDEIAKPKFPPPNIAIRTGYGGGKVRDDDDANKHDDFVVALAVVNALLLCRYKQT
jgi:hypothetical protein